MFSIKFSDAAAALMSANSAVALAEGHGCLSGALCASRDYSLTRWLEELLDESPAETDPAVALAVAAAKESLRGLYDDTVRALRGDEMEFQAFLPDDDAPLAQRAEALAQWCQGFLYGFGSTIDRGRKLSDEIDEVLRDLTQISRAAAGDSEPTEDDEADYVEITEYVRTGVQLIHDELRPTLQ